MSTRQLKRRLALVQEKVGPKDKLSYTWEELCREMWQDDRQAFIELANELGSICRPMLEQFQREDEDRATRNHFTP